MSATVSSSSSTAAAAAAGAKASTKTKRASRSSFLAAVRRLLWDDGDRSSDDRMLPPPPPSSSMSMSSMSTSAGAGEHGRKRPREETDGAACGGGGGGGRDTPSGGNRGELQLNPGNLDSKSPPHLARSATKQPARRPHNGGGGGGAAGGGVTPTILVSSDEESEVEDGAARGNGNANGNGNGNGNGNEMNASVAVNPPPAKRSRTSNGAVTTAAAQATATATAVVDDYPCSALLCSPCAAPKEESSLLLRTLPPEVLSSDVLGYLASSADRRSLQLACRQFRDATDRPYFLARLDIGGVGVEGRRGLLLEGDSADDAVAKLVRYSRAGNMQAVYMLGMLKAYCFDSPRQGIALLRMCADQGYVRASYALGLVLRDSSRDESRNRLIAAARGGYLPAYQEILPAQEVKSRFGDLDARRLRGYLDFPCLNRLLGRHYVDCNPRSVQTSHCWNPLCGRWAYKATPSVDRYLRQRDDRARERRIRQQQQQQQQQQNRVEVEKEEKEEEGASGDSKDASASVSSSLSSLLGDGGGGNAMAQCGACPSSAPSRPRVFRPPPPPGRNNNNRAAAAHGAGIGDDDSGDDDWVLRVSRMKMCSSCRRAKYCSKLCQVYDWRSGRHKTECQFLG